MHRYPTLEFIDRALGTYSRGFAESPNATLMEQRARQLADEYWSEMVWLTGRVPEAAFRAVCSALQQEQVTEPRVVTLIVAEAPTAQPVPVWIASNRPAYGDQEDASPSPM